MDTSMSRCPQVSKGVGVKNGAGLRQLATEQCYTERYQGYWLAQTQKIYRNKVAHPMPVILKEAEQAIVEMSKSYSKQFPHN